MVLRYPARVVAVDGRLEYLRPAEAHLLEALAQERRLWSRWELEDEMGIDLGNSLAVTLCALRKKIGHDAIRTHCRAGVILVRPCTVVIG